MAGLNLALVVSLADRASRPLQKLSGAVERLGARAERVGSRLRGLGASALPRLTLPIATFGGFALKAAADLEQMETAYTSMLGDAGQAKSLVEDLMDFAARTPFQLQGIGNATRQLLAMGVEQDNIISDLQLIGDVAAGAQVPIEEMTQIYAKGLGKGKVQAEELNQMSERGIPILQALVDLAAKYGNDITKEDVYKAAERGEIGFNAMREALELLTEKGGPFHEQMRLQSETAHGLASTLKDNLFNAAVKIGEKLDEVFGVKEGMKDLIAWVQDMTARFETFAEENPELLKIAFSLAAIAALAGPLLIGLGFAAAGIGIVAGALAVVLAPIGLFIAAIVAAGAVAAWLYADWEGATAFFENLWKGIVDAVPDDPFGWLQTKWDAALDHIEVPAPALWSWLSDGSADVFAWVGRQWDAATDLIGTAAPALWSWLSDGSADVFAWVGRQWDAATDLIGTAAPALWSWLSDGSADVFAWVGRQWDAATDLIGTAAPALWSWLSDGSADVFAWVGRQWDAATDLIGTAAPALWSWLSDGSADVFAWVGRQWDAATDLIGTAAPALWSWLSDGSADVFAWVGRQWDAVKALIEQPATAVWDWLKSPDPTIFNWIDAEWAQTLAAIGAGTGVSIGLDLPTAAEALVWAGGALTAIAAAIDKIDWKNLGKMIGEGVRAGFLALMSIFDSGETASGEVKSAFRRVFGGIGDLLKSILQGALDAMIGFIEGVFGVDLEKALRDVIDTVTGWLPDWVKERIGLSEADADGPDAPAAVAGAPAVPSALTAAPPRPTAFGGAAPALAAAGSQETRVGGEMVVRFEGAPRGTRIESIRSDNRDIPLTAEMGFGMASP